MSAEGRWHEDAPKKIDERVISEERLFWTQTRESEESFAPAQERIRDADRHPEITSDVALEGDDARNRLLCAISDSEFAKRIRELTPADPHAAGPFPMAGAEVQPSARVGRAASAAGPTRTLIVQTSPVGASMPLMPQTATEPRHPAPPASDRIIEMEKAGDRLLRSISEAGRLGGEIPASNPQFRFLVQTSSQAASEPLMPPAAATPHRPVSARPRTIEGGTWDAVAQVPTPQQPMAVAESVPAITTPRRDTPAQGRSPRTAILVRYGGEINRLNAKLARNTKSMGRVLWQISVRFKNRALAKTALTLESSSRAATQVSIQFSDWIKTKAAPATERLGRSMWQLSIRLWNMAGAKAALTMGNSSRAATQLSIQFKYGMKTKAAPAMEHLGQSARRLLIRLWNMAKTKASPTKVSSGIAGSQLSTGLDECAHATQSAADIGSMGQARSQFPTRLQKWFGPRRSPRLAEPPVVAYCWTVDTPDPIRIADISSGGVHLLTNARWPRGGVLSMTLQRTDRTSETPESWIVIDFMVTRLCSDGVAGAFISSTHRLSSFIPSRAENCADDRTLKRFVRHLAVPNNA